MSLTETAIEIFSYKPLSKSLGASVKWKL